MTHEASTVTGRVFVPIDLDGAVAAAKRSGDRVREEAAKLRTTAFTLVCTYLADRGNTLSVNQRAALEHLMAVFSDYVFGLDRGRKAFPLMAGGGKTSSVACFIAAMHRQGVRVPLSVAASQVRLLSDLYREIVGLGVPPELVGIFHSKPEADVETQGLVSSTGEQSRLFQLVTHARIKNRSHENLVRYHQGKERPLVIWDECLLRAEPLSRPIQFLRAAAEGISAAWVCSDEVQVATMAFLRECGAALDKAHRDLNGDPKTYEVSLAIPVVGGCTVEAAERFVSATPNLPNREDALLLLKLSQHEQLRLTRSGEGQGIVSYRIVVPEGYRNVVVLDASWGVRELAKLDASIKIEETLPIKQYSKVRISLMERPGGRFSATGKGLHAYAKEVADVIEAHPESNILVFGYKARSRDKDPLAKLQETLARKAILLNDAAIGYPDRKRINLTHWGTETGSNAWDHCDLVFLMGVMHPDSLMLTAAMKGQLDNIGADVRTHIERVLRGELVHLMYQAANRGTCRKTEPGAQDGGTGEARSMSLYVIHADRATVNDLAKLMPGLQQNVWQPKHTVRVGGRPAIRRDKIAAAIVAFLKEVPDSVETVTSRRVRIALGALADCDRDTWLTACNQALRAPDLGGLWVRAAQGFARMFAAEM